MKYFEAMVDQRMSYKYQIQSMDWQGEDEACFGMAYFKGHEEDLPDFFIYDKLFFVSAELKQVIEMYTNQVQFKLVMLNNIELKIQKEYYTIEAPRIDALGEHMTYLKNGWIDTMSFDCQKIADIKVFHLENIKANAFTPVHLFVDLDLVESILRRALWGVYFQEIVTEV